ncbi:hypothetical protein [Streptomyces sp. NPDC086787]|uniref:hypothetical protein n=1 Tax=Streptomyces sp. NPDC086787 TaxID=3365759 RepID=UPI00381CC51E
MRQAARTACALTALSLTALTLSACGGGSGSDSAETSATASAPKQVTPADRLTKLVITDADVHGFKVKKPDSDYAFAASRDDVTVDKPACKPVAYALNQLPLGKPEADLTRDVAQGAYSGVSTYVTLTSYASGEAKSTLAELSKSVAACGGGFTAKAKVNTSSYDSVSTEKAPSGGDETLAFKSTLAFRGIHHTLRTEAVRRGDVIAVYFSVNGFAIGQGKPSDAKLPDAVVKAQNAKLG